MYRMFRACALAFCLAGSALAAPAATQSDRDFLAARAAFERGDRGRLDALAPRLAEHVLLTYVEFWQRMLQLETATDEQIGAFFVRWPKSPLADRLRVDWLKMLGKRGQWSTFATHYPPPAGEDVELACFGCSIAASATATSRSGTRNRSGSRARRRRSPARRSSPP